VCPACRAGNRQDAKAHLLADDTAAEDALKRMPEVQEELPEAAKPGAWIDRGEVWFDRDAGQIHYILRAAGGWTRHKVVGKDPKRKHRPDEDELELGRRSHCLPYQSCLRTQSGANHV
jgi:hypothetical protein